MTSFPGLRQPKQSDGNPERHLGNSFSGVRMSHPPVDQSSV